MEQRYIENQNIKNIRGIPKFIRSIYKIIDVN